MKDARHTRQEAAASERCDDGIDVRQVLEDLEADCSIAADEVIVVERVDEVSGHPLGPVLLDGAPTFVERSLNDRGAEPFDGAQLGVWSGVHDHYAAARADLSRRERDALCGVTCADRPDTASELGGRQLADGVVGAANLERADGLQRLQLEENLWPAGLRQERHERRASGRLVDVC